ncbi:MAG: 50S ribosomal protein L29 [Nitrospinae bacterium]|nr:50S ribosomal protein L29 [Nitrospinota bacterium]
MKAIEFRDLTNEELLKKLEEMKSELLKLRFQEARKVLENPMRFRILKKDIARINTILNEKGK